MAHYHEAVFDDGVTELMINFTGDGNTGELGADDFRMNLYAFDKGTGVPKFTLQLPREDAAKLYRHLGELSIIQDESKTKTSKIIEVDPEVLTPKLLEALKGDADLFHSVLESDPEAVRTFVELKLDHADVVSVAYRKAELDVMAELIADPVFFEAKRVEWECNGREAVWQKFFERNPWIFGYALDYIVGEPHADKLEQVTSGFSVGGPGKRADALLQTRGLIRSLCFAEIKIHDTDLLYITKEYRPGCWRPSKELAGGVAQSHTTVQLALETIGTLLKEKDGDGFEVGEVFNVMPRSFLVIGTLDQFRNDAGNIHHEKFRSFELFRRQVVNPEIITFDELLARARMIVDAVAPEDD